MAVESLGFRDTGKTAAHDQIFELVVEIDKPEAKPRKVGVQRKGYYSRNSFQRLVRALLQLGVETSHKHLRDLAKSK